jgi:hypothetical protein
VIGNEKDTPARPSLSHGAGVVAPSLFERTP